MMLNMCTALTSLRFVAAQAHSPGTAAALTRELSLSQTARLEGFTKSIPDMIPKAYRVSPSRSCVFNEHSPSPTPPHPTPPRLR